MSVLYICKNGKLQQQTNKIYHVLFTGDHDSTLEDLDRTGRPIRRAKVSMAFKNIGRQIDVTSQLQDGNWFGNKVNCGLYSFSEANPKIKLAEQPHGWDVGMYVCKTRIDVQSSNSCPISTSRASVPQIYVLFFKFSNRCPNSQIFGHFSLSQIDVTDAYPNPIQ